MVEPLSGFLKVTASDEQKVRKLGCQLYSKWKLMIQNYCKNNIYCMWCAPSNPTSYPHKQVFWDYIVV